MSYFKKLSLSSSLYLMYYLELTVSWWKICLQTDIYKCWYLHLLWLGVWICLHILSSLKEHRFTALRKADGWNSVLLMLCRYVLWKKVKRAFWVIWMVACCMKNSFEVNVFEGCNEMMVYKWNMNCHYNISTCIYICLSINVSLIL